MEFVSATASARRRCVRRCLNVTAGFISINTGAIGSLLTGHRYCRRMASCQVGCPLLEIVSRILDCALTGDSFADAVDRAIVPESAVRGLIIYRLPAPLRRKPTSSAEPAVHRKFIIRVLEVLKIAQAQTKRTSRRAGGEVSQRIVITDRDQRRSGFRQRGSG